LSESESKRKQSVGEEDARGKRMWKEKAQGRKMQEGRGCGKRRRRGGRDKGRRKRGRTKRKDPPVMPILIQRILRGMIFLPSTPVKQTWR
jgi:hypothetical protein